LKTRRSDEINEFRLLHYLQQRTIDVVKIGGIRAQLLRICVHAEKRMGTLRMALRLPVTIATMLMLVSPLFGDLRTQVFVKLVTLLLQTLCFLFLCSIAPENGFAGTKPKIYTFFETVFVLTLLSVVITMVAMALSRVRRTVPPSHNVFLTAKMINRFVCCIEPEPGTSYQRHVDETAQTNFGTPQPDYTMEWRHIYIAANNLFSGVSFTIFVFVAAFDIL
uniref:Neur_chan_memb domain-containing protein n=2 Tax=Toxocara canis TaxID=6265 RepID=A0A183U5P7_TOXCA